MVHFTSEQHRWILSSLILDAGVKKSDKCLSDKSVVSDSGFGPKGSLILNIVNASNIHSNPSSASELHCFRRNVII